MNSSLRASWSSSLVIAVVMGLVAPACEHCRRKIVIHEPTANESLSAAALQKYGWMIPICYQPGDSRLVTCMTMGVLSGFSPADTLVFQHDLEELLTAQLHAYEASSQILFEDEQELLTVLLSGSHQIGCWKDERGNGGSVHVGDWSAFQQLQAEYGSTSLFFLEPSPKPEGAKPCKSGALVAKVAPLGATAADVPSFASVYRNTYQSCRRAQQGAPKPVITGVSAGGRGPGDAEPTPKPDATTTPSPEGTPTPTGDPPSDTTTTPPSSGGPPTPTGGDTPPPAKTPAEIAAQTAKQTLDRVKGVTHITDISKDKITLEIPGFEIGPLRVDSINIDISRPPGGGQILIGGSFTLFDKVEGDSFGPNECRRRAESAALAAYLESQRSALCDQNDVNDDEHCIVIGKAPKNDP